ncbi:cytochrome c oxidase assembly protein [Pseudomonas sp. MYb185]|uniref:cytochrome c oxidase assembly protein n=1 Tax=Pseudomonas sp. MYb185 TaxID=1848729 RepID=UPI000CFB144E|nr:cytochrome c oxidase assembly protein [Pseudomonas sp. MYb185]PRB84377.1 cytochrome c oxidase caa3-type, assembly factor CtaG-like protein [Pseudomonas sp. MYb185]
MRTGPGAGAWPLALGFVVLAGLWLGPLPAMSRTAFSAHMLLHLGVVVLAAPLLAIGLVRAGVCLDRVGGLRTWMVVVFAMEMVVVWGWHAPALHEAAARHVGVFVLQQFSFLVVGLGVWLLGFATLQRGAMATAILGFALTSTHMTMLGLLLTLAPRLIYPAELCLGAFGFEQLEDQRFGGVLMAAWGGLAYMAGGVVLGCRLLWGADVEEVVPGEQRDWR